MTVNSTDIGFLPFIVIITIIFTVALLLPILPGRIVAAIVRRRTEMVLKKNTGIIITQYDPPHDLSPAEIGLLYDSVCGDKEIRATLFDLQQRGIISFTSESSIVVTDRTAYDHLPEYAKIAVRMFDKQMAQLDPHAKEFTYIVYAEDGPQTMHSSIHIPQNKWVFTRAVQQSLRNKGYNVRDYHLQFWCRVGIGVIILWILPWLLFTAMGAGLNEVDEGPWSLTSFTSGFLLSFIVGFFLFPAYLIASFIAVKVFVAIAGRYWVNTKQVRKLWPELEGYRIFLQQVDLDEIQFESANSEFSPVVKTLPYAMIFNLDTKWQERLRKLV
jgi:hypothetical protein